MERMDGQARRIPGGASAGWLPYARRPPAGGNPRRSFMWRLPHHWEPAPGVVRLPMLRWEGLVINARLVLQARAPLVVVVLLAACAPTAAPPAAAPQATRPPASAAVAPTAAPATQAPQAAPS